MRTWRPLSASTLLIRMTRFRDLSRLALPIWIPAEYWSTASTSSLRLAHRDLSPNCLTCQQLATKSSIATYMSMQFRDYPSIVLIATSIREFVIIVLIARHDPLAGD